MAPREPFVAIASLAERLFGQVAGIAPKADRHERTRQIIDTAPRGESIEIRPIAGRAFSAARRCA
jgi:hypothetical protein